MGSPVFHARPQHGPPRLCRLCRRPLEGDADDICDQPQCQTRHKIEVTAEIAQKRERKKAAWRAISHRRTRGVLREAAREIGVSDLGHIAHGLAPYIDVPLVPLPDARRAAFETHLRAIIGESFAKADGVTHLPEPPEDDPDFTLRLKQEKPEPAVLDTACIACQGDCCLMGGGRHAFLTAESITCQRWKDPDWTEDGLLQTYLSHIPPTSISGSCVYHGPQGCTLDRPLRANICNSFQCPSRRELSEAVARRPGTGAVVAGLSRTHVNDRSAGAPYLRVVSMSPENKVTVHDGLTLPALRKGMPDD